MGQAKERKKRLGKWYGQPIGPGHPDFVSPKKPIRSPRSTQEEPPKSEPIQVSQDGQREPEGPTAEPQSASWKTQIVQVPKSSYQRRPSILLALSIVGAIGIGFPDPGSKHGV